MTENSFEIGDVIKTKDSAWDEYGKELQRFGFMRGATYEVSGVYNQGSTISIQGSWSSYYAKYFELHLGTKVEPNESIARPILEERKVGKVQMDLFDEGFANAVFEVAKVMTWAAENKGYKPHDWVNLPDAESSFQAAASRHRVKGLIQKVSGVAVTDRVDEESAILHKAHEAFNVLAELELMMRGKIK